ncbi:MAG: hypothetical protein P1P86_08955 [Bacteroidales bacterium]|nr:hypothetical protein [Bacteroidales bacterium]
MKTTKLIVVFLLLTLGAAINRQTGQERFITADYSVKNNRFEDRVSGFLSRTENIISKENMEPAVYKYYFYDHADIVYEEVLGLEEWMTTPFESAVAENEMTLEEWMTTPFESRLTEEELTIEPWMLSPFNS